MATIRKAIAPVPTASEFLDVRAAHRTAPRCENLTQD